MNGAQLALADPLLLRTPPPPSSSPAGPAPAQPVRPPAGRKLPASLAALWHPQSPLAWFGLALATTGVLVAVTHGHIGGEVAAHVGPAHGEAGIGGGA